MADTHPLLLLTRKLPGDQMARLRDALPGGRIVGEEELAGDPLLISRIDICYPGLPAGLWKRAARLKWLQTDMAGLDSVLKLPDAREHPAVFTNVHIHANCTAEHLWGMTLMLTRNLHAARNAQMEKAWNPAALSQGLSTLSGRVLCVVGLGAIGRRCAQLGRAFGMRVIGIRRNPRPAAEAEEIVGPGERRAAFARARVIMMLLPGTAETRGFVGREELASMKGAFLLNAGRGSSVDADALVDALRAGNVRGAGLDVVDPEPLPPASPLWSMPNVIITPHYAGVHPGCEEEAFGAFLSNLGRWTRGEPLENIVDKQAGY